MDVREIAKDRIRFPDHDLTVDQGWNLGIGIERTIGISIGVSELASVVFANIRLLEFLQKENDLLNIPRCLSAE
jgi:hypothetical protein